MPADDRGELPEALRNAMASDEAFWCRQEKTIQGASGQPACTLSGISTGLIRLQGNLAVIVHGEDECASCFLHYGPSAHRFFATGLEEQHFVSGRTQDRLRRCLRLVAEELRPDAIFVLGTCPMEVIGDRFEEVVAEVQVDHPAIAMRALHTSGLKVGSQAQMLDWMYSELVGLPPLEPKAPDAAVALDPARCVNFLGLPEVEQLGLRGHEWDRVLQAAGVHVVGAYPYDVDLDGWRSMGFAQATLVVDRSLYPRTVAALEARGQRVLEVPLPVGIEQTDRFYEVIGQTFGISDDLREATAPARAEAVAALQSFRDRHGPLRMVMGLRMLNDYRTDQVAYHGLGDYRAVAELGFDVSVLVQGPKDKKDRFQKLFEARGIDIPFDVFAEPWNLAELIAGRYDFAYLADYCREEARKARVPMVVSRHLAPYYGGVVHNVASFGQSLAAARAALAGN